MSGPASESVAGKGVVVTGAGDGIDRALATALAGTGARLVVNDIDAGAARSVTDEINAHAVADDAVGAEGVTALVAAADDHLSPLVSERLALAHIAHGVQRRCDGMTVGRVAYVAGAGS